MCDGVELDVVNGVKEKTFRLKKKFLRGGLYVSLPF